ncbi:MAG: NADH:ubiquinone oxidoreductase subunit NDUFA12 [Alphaproteobacteria bacterium]|nr:NADH:ubiquinone oxidoreductase subunit NDUFA12 [Alphaproteobacteria bacterium]MDX5368194.1 NADH:ubiquinone oxidoreductase subunit NDUFA12 [Alphaproteobacteria bacterium]MDX5463010.1 NADH:ubiquinone oxidoreductase subunit NDUFA12 [Alphaproteobacteria bacterium]
MKLLKQIFTWWNGQTIGTALYTWRKGVRVGEDGAGNVYYRSRQGDRRWVIYNGEAEASRVPPDWHAWLHHTVKEPPTVAPLPSKPWEKPHMPNPTGSEAAYFPPGSLARGGNLARPAPDYEAWQPE